MMDKKGHEQTQYFLILNLHPLEQKVWGDFKVQFKSAQAEFYFWLNVSAILYNNELRIITEKQGLHNDPIHFNEFEEFEETDFRSNKTNMLSLLLPDAHESILPHNDEETDKNNLHSETSHRTTIQQLMDDQMRLSKEFYGDCSTNNTTTMQSLEKIASSPGL